MKIQPTFLLSVLFGSVRHARSFTSTRADSILSITRLICSGSVTLIWLVLYCCELSAQGWLAQNSGTTRHLWGVFFTDSSTGTAVGDSGTILRTTDGGTTWLAQSSGTTNTLFSVFFTDVNTGTAAGADGTILRTTNGGVTWVRQASGMTNFELLGVSFVGPNTGSVVGPGFDGGTILRTTNGGETWLSQSSGIGLPFYIRGVFLLDADTGFAVGDGGITLRTANGGTRWTIQQISGVTNSLNGISFSTTRYGTVVGNDGVVAHTTDGGETWTIQPSGTTRRLRGVSFTDCNTGTVVGDAGTILRTTDAGATWTNQRSGTTESLTSVSFTDFNNGTVVGLSGKILRTTTGGVVPVAVEPFMPSAFSLDQNYPNPFNPSTTIKYTVSSRQLISIDVYDILGRRIERIVNEAKEAGTYEVEWNAGDRASGVYIYQMKSSEKPIAVKKMVLIR